jgi:hypothetical protein
MRHLRAIMSTKAFLEDWQYSLPLVQRIMNASVHDSIGVSPAQLLFGNSINLDRGIFLPFVDKSGETVSLSEWATKMLSKQADLLKIARDTQVVTSEHHIATKRAARGEVYTEYPVNSYVLVNYHDRPPSKLHTHLKGPMRVVSSEGAAYVLQDLVTNRTQNVHVSKLRQFNYDPTVTDPRLEANKDKQSFDVEKIISMHGNARSKKSELRFRVRWVGYSEEDDTYATWADLRNNSVLHQYLIAHKMLGLVPSQYRAEAEATYNQNRL